MGQVNVTYDERLLRDLDRLASVKSLSRADLLRTIASEAVEAHDAGRLAFQVDDTPRIEGSINALVGQLRDAVVELDRSQRANQKHERKLLEALAGGEEANRIAQQRLTDRINARHRATLHPFLSRVEELHGRLDAVQISTAQAVEEKLYAFTPHIDRLEALAAEPRTAYNLVLSGGDTLSWRFLAASHGLAGFCGFLLIFIAVSHMPLLAVPLAGRLLGNSKQVCALLDRRYDGPRCTVPVKERQRVLGKDKG